MPGCCGSTSLIPVLCIAGLGALGVGGYNLVTSGCPLGSCHGDSAKTTLVSTQTDEGSCPMCPGHAEQGAATLASQTTEDETCHGGVCPVTGETGATILASETTEAAGCCPEQKSEEDCTGGGCGACPDGCEEGKQAEQPAQVATSGGR